MNVLAQMAFSQLKNNKKRTFWAVTAIVLATALLTCVCGLVASGYEMLTSFLGADFSTYRSAYLSLLLVPAIILGLIILLMAVIVISNVFRVSASERITEFGMLKCVGATEDQIRKSIFYEGAFLSVAGIPLGILAGVALTAGTVGVTNSYLAELNALTNIMLKKLNFELQFVLSVPALLISGLIALVTVFVAAWLPAKKASAGSAIENIKGLTPENTKKKAKEKAPKEKPVGDIFGAEGFLAGRNISYNKRNFKATVWALAIGMILFTVVGSVSSQVRRMSDMMYSFKDYTVTADYQSARIREQISENGEYKSVYPAPIDSRTGQEITEKLEEFDHGDVYGMGQEYDLYDVTLNETELSPEYLSASGLTETKNITLDVEIIVLDDEHYRELCEKHGISVGSAILLNHSSINENGYETDYVPFTEQLTELQLENQNGEVTTCPVDAVLYKEDIPTELFYPNTNPVRLIVEHAVVRGYSWMHTPEDADGYMNYASELLDSYFPKSEDAEYMESGFAARVYLTKDYIRIMNIAIVLALVLSYCFVAILMLIGFTNVISTLSANVLMRAREFAVFISIGMTGRDLRKMLYLEGILCVKKALFIGIPVSIAATYLINYPIKKMYPIPYELPVLSMAAYAMAVMIVTVVITGMASRKIQRKSIIETIRTV